VQTQVSLFNRAPPLLTHFSAGEKVIYQGISVMLKSPTTDYRLQPHI